MKIFPLLTLLPALLFAAWDANVDSTWYTRNKTATTYTIYTADEFAGLIYLTDRDHVSFKGKTIKLGADIALNDTNLAGGWRNWNSTSNLNQWPSIAYFEGNFDGNGKVISGLYINTTSSYAGLFSPQVGAISISNLGLVGFYVKGGSYVGSISGGSYNSTVTNSYAIGNVQTSGTNSSVSGIVGGGGIVKNSYFAGTITGSPNINAISAGSDVTNSFYDTDLAGILNGKGAPKTTEDMQNVVCNSLKVYAGIQNEINANNNYIGWKCNANNYPSFSGTKAEPTAIASLFASGTGTPANPYIIMTKKQLEDFSFLSSNNIIEGEHIKLGADIALNDTNWAGGWRNWDSTTTGLNRWTPIENFRYGVFDGNGKVISGLYINTTYKYQGLFGHATTGTISNLGLVGFYVKGGSYVGGISGNSSINYENVSNYLNVRILNSYAIGNVSGINFVGGISGTDDFIANSYFAGTVTGSGNNVSGISGGSEESPTNSFYDSNLAGNLPNGTPQTTADMQSVVCDLLQIYAGGQNEINANSDFAYWANFAGWKCNANNYPSFSGTKAVINALASYFASGDGTPANPYTITTKKQLEGFSLLSLANTFEGKYIKLGADIVLNDTNESGGWRNWNDATTGLNKWNIPIGYCSNGNSSSYFKGNFDGNGKVISGLYISRPDYKYSGVDRNFKGLFGCSDGNISNLGLAGFYVNGCEGAGGIISVNKGTVTNSYAIGNLNATRLDIGREQVCPSSVGGITANNSGTVTNSYFIGTVYGGNSGGIVGYYSNGTGRITNSYSAAEYGNYYTTNQGCTNVSSLSFYDGTLAGSSSRCGVRKTTEQMKQKATYQGWDFGNVWGIGYPKNNPLNGGMPYLQWQTPISQAHIEPIPSEVSYTGSPIKPTPAVTLSGVVKVAGVDFNYEYEENTNAGTGSVAIVGKTEELRGAREFTFSIKKVQIPKPSLVLPTTFTYDGTAKTVSANLDPTDNHFTISGVTTGTNAGTYKVTIALTNPANYEWQITQPNSSSFELSWKIDKAPSNCQVSMADFIAGGTPSNPVPSSTTESYITSSKISYTYKSLNDNSYPEQSSKPVSVVGRYKVTATFTNDNYENCTASTEFSILTAKELQVSWTTDSVFTYNKMPQAPVPSVYEPGVELMLINSQSFAGIYKDGMAAIALIKDEAQRRNYTLLNNTKNFEIKKKPLKPYFNVPATFSNSSTDTLWVPSEIFADQTLLRQTLNSFLRYDGFAQDTVSKEKDDASVLKSSPAISITYNTPLQTRQKMLAKRVETTQTAVAVINTDNVSADNYVLAKRSIVIMETIDTDDSGSKVFCRRESYCTELSEAVCSFFGGTPVGSCEIKVSCLVENVSGSRCASGLSLEECRGIGGTALIVSCEEATPIKWSFLPTTAFRVWQTASGVVNVDLGYMPASPVSVQIYNLQGKLITTGEASTRFASIKLNAGSGVYLFKAGNRNTIKAIK